MQWGRGRGLTRVLVHRSQVHLGYLATPTAWPTRAHGSA